MVGRVAMTAVIIIIVLLVSTVSQQGGSSPSLSGTAGVGGALEPVPYCPNMPPMGAALDHIDCRLVLLACWCTG